MRFTATQTKWLKTAHLITVACWLGGALALVLLHQLRFAGVAPGSELHGIDRAAHLIDMGIVVLAGAMGCLATGLLYSLHRVGIFPPPLGYRQMDHHGLRHPFRHLLPRPLGRSHAGPFP